MRLLIVCDYLIQFHPKWCLGSVLNLSSFFKQVELNLSPDALKLIAKKALEKKTGARGLRAILVCAHYNCYKPSSLGNVSGLSPLQPLFGVLRDSAVSCDVQIICAALDATIHIA